jgi:hypothetical protein
MKYLLVALWAAGFLAACSAKTESEHLPACDVRPAQIRDADTEPLQRGLAPAQEAAYALRRDAELGGVVIDPRHGAQPAYEAVQKDKPVINVQMQDGQLRASNMLKSEWSAPPLGDLNDLSLGPARAMETSAQVYPGQQIAALTLHRGADCKLVWDVALNPLNSGPGASAQSVTVSNDGQVLGTENR